MGEYKHYFTGHGTDHRPFPLAHGGRAQPLRCFHCDEPIEEVEVEIESCPCDQDDVRAWVREHRDPIHAEKVVRLWHTENDHQWSLDEWELEVIASTWDGGVALRESVE